MKTITTLLIAILAFFVFAMDTFAKSSPPVKPKSAVERVTNAGVHLSHFNLDAGVSSAVMIQNVNAIEQFATAPVFMEQRFTLYNRGISVDKNTAGYHSKKYRGKDSKKLPYHCRRV